MVYILLLFLFFIFLELFPFYIFLNYFLYSKFLSQPIMNTNTPNLSFGLGEYEESVCKRV